MDRNGDDIGFGLATFFLILFAVIVVINVSDVDQFEQGLTMGVGAGVWAYLQQWRKNWEFRNRQ